MPQPKLKKVHTRSTFSERVIAAVRSIPKGRVTTYGRIAKACGGGAMASQSITAILGKAYESGVHDIPFHRIVYANGNIWIDDAHTAKRLALYKKEGIALDVRNRIANFDDIVFEFR